MGRYRFLFRPRWLVTHVVAALLAVLLVNLGLWQLRRLDQRQDLNRRLDERAAAATVDIGTDPWPAGAEGPDAAQLEFRTATASGRYRADEEVLVRSRSLDGAPGAWVLTPLVLDDGRALVVNRGWIPASGPPTLPPGAEAPSGRVEVEGLLMASQIRGSFGPRDPAEGRLPTLARADLARLGAQVDEPLHPFYLQLRTQAPPGNELPVLLPPPERGEGPHLGYAFQWFTFALLGVGAYLLLLRRTARGIQRAPAPTRTTDQQLDQEESSPVAPGRPR